MEEYFTYENFIYAASLFAERYKGYVDDPDQEPEPRCFGLTRRDYPSLKEMDRERALQIYKEKYWTIALDKVESEMVSYKLLEVLILIPKPACMIIINRALRACGTTIIDERTPFNRAVTTFINTCDEQSYTTALKCEMAAYYRAFCREHKLSEKLQKELLDRAYR